MCLQNMHKFNRVKTCVHVWRTTWRTVSDWSPVSFIIVVLFHAVDCWGGILFIKQQKSFCLTAIIDTHLFLSFWLSQHTTFQPPRYSMTRGGRVVTFYKTSTTTSLSSSQSLTKTVPNQVRLVGILVGTKMLLWLCFSALDFLFHF